MLMNLVVLVFLKLQAVVWPAGCASCLTAHAMPPPPDVERGDWLRARGPRTKIRLKFYVWPPSVRAAAELQTAYEPGQYFGPVHAVEVTDRFVSARVPHPQHRELLVWTNVWTSGDFWETSTAFCFRVPPRDLASWMAAGWENRYVDESEAALTRAIDDFVAGLQPQPLAPPPPTTQLAQQLPTL